MSTQLRGSTQLKPLSVTGAELGPAEFTTATTGNIDDLNFGKAATIRMNNATLATIRGLVAGAPGQRVTIVSVGAGQVDLSNQDTGDATAASRLICFVTSGKTPLAAGKGTATLEYDGTTARWRLVTHDQGALIAFTPVVSFGGASVGVTYTNQTGNFYITGRLIWIDARCALSSKGSSTGGAQIDGMPYALSALSATCVIDAFNLVGMTGTPYIIPNGLGLVIAQTAATGRGLVADTNFANNTDVRGGGTFGI
jgi:hypothetical protein